MKEMNCDQIKELDLNSIEEVAGGVMTTEQMEDGLNFALRYNDKMRELKAAGKHDASYALWVKFNEVSNAYFKRANSEEGTTELLSELIDLDAY